MSSKNSNKLNIPEARAAMDKFKMEAASEVGVNLKNGYNGDLTSREAGSVGGQMVKKMIESYEKGLYRRGLNGQRGWSASALQPLRPRMPPLSRCWQKVCRRRHTGQSTLKRKKSPITEAMGDFYML